MKKVVVLFVFLLFLTGCSGSSKELDAGMQLRSELLKASLCSFTAQITADYGNRICSFTVDSAMDANGDLSYTVVEPTTIAGISGKLSGQGGRIIFDEIALDFPLMGDGLPSPVSAPWILTKALRSGFLTSACLENEEIRLSVDDRYDDDDLQLDIWLDSEKKPVHADILHEGRRILTMDISKFLIS